MILVIKFKLFYRCNIFNINIYVIINSYRYKFFNYTLSLLVFYRTYTDVESDRGK
jgi:hypothetical protein